MTKSQIRIIKMKRNANTMVNYRPFLSLSLCNGSRGRGGEGAVNCYLIKTPSGYILIDTGLPKKYNDLEIELETAGRAGSDRRTRF